MREFVLKVWAKLQLSHFLAQNDVNLKVTGDLHFILFFLFAVIIGTCALLFSVGALFMSTASLKWPLKPLVPIVLVNVIFYIIHMKSCVRSVFSSSIAHVQNIVYIQKLIVWRICSLGGGNKNPNNLESDNINSNVMLIFIHNSLNGGGKVIYLTQDYFHF